jgi:hypothetical protein
MKKLLLAIGASILVAASASGQNWKSENFLNGQIATLVVTNTGGITNLSSILFNQTAAYATNTPQTMFTNVLGTLVAVTNNLTWSNQNILVDVPLYVARDGQPLFVGVGTTNNQVLASPLNVMIDILTAGSGANSAVNFVFVPLFDVYGTLFESTSAGDAWTVGVTAATTTRTCVITNVPTWKWPGVKALRLKSITNTDTDITSQVWLDAVSLGGFIP